VTHFNKRHLGIQRLEMASMSISGGAKAAGCIVGILLFSSLASAIDINGYSSVHNDRFSSAYPTAPIANANGNFLWQGLACLAAWRLECNPNRSFALS
jgi:hypothetical protein